VLDLSSPRPYEYFFNIFSTFFGTLYVVHAAPLDRAKSKPQKTQASSNASTLAPANLIFQAA
jgi:hypothetical protein